jgi:hypothetical protein
VKTGEDVSLGVVVVTTTEVEFLVGGAAVVLLGGGTAAGIVMPTVAQSFWANMTVSVACVGEVFWSREV